MPDVPRVMQVMTMRKHFVNQVLKPRHQFGRLVALGITTTFFLYFFINMAMVMGLVPVVGIPLPLVSYGGTAMLTLLAGAGLLISVSVHRDVEIPRWHG